MVIGLWSWVLVILKIFRIFKVPKLTRLGKLLFFLVEKKVFISPGGTIYEWKKEERFQNDDFVKFGSCSQL